MVDEASKIREEILNGRAELAETVQALVEKADVKGRVRDAVSENATQIQHVAAEKASHLSDVARSTAKNAKTANRSYLAGAGGLMFLLVMFLLIRKGRSAA